MHAWLPEAVEDNDGDDHLADHDEERVVEVVAGDDGLVQEVHGHGAAAVEQGGRQTLALVRPVQIVKRI